MRRLPVQDRYVRDVQFKALVDALYHMLCDMNMTPTEVREAAMLATMKFEQDHIRPVFWIKDTIYEDPNKKTQIEPMNDIEYQRWLAMYGDDQ